MKAPRFLRTYSGLNRSIYFLFLAQIVNSLGHFVHPFLTLYLTKKLGMGAAEAGFYVFLSAAAWVPASFIGGKIADSFGRKTILLLFQSLAALTLIPCAFLGTNIAVAWLLILSSFFQGIAEPVNDAMITDMTKARQRKAAFSLLYLGHNIGFAVGPMIAGFLFNRFITWIFIGDAVTTGIALILVAIFTRETRPTEEQIQKSFEEEEEDHPEKAEKGSLLGVLFRRPFLLAFMFIHVLLSIVYSQVTFSLPLQLTAVFGEAGPANYGVLMVANALVVIFLTTLVIHATTKVPPALTVALSGLFFALGFGFTGIVDNMTLLLILTATWTIGEILGATNASAYVANHAPITHRGRINAVAPVIMYSGQAFGPPLAGWLIERFSLDLIWPFSFALSFLAAALLVLVYLLERRKKRKKRLQPA